MDHCISDSADIVSNLKKNIPRAMKAQISDVIYNHELANDIVVSAIFTSESEFAKKVSL